MSHTDNKKNPCYPMAAVVALIAAVCGCTAMNLPKPPKIDLPWSESNKPQIPDSVVAMWTDTVMQQSGKQGVRGFGGRLMFYKKNKEEPVKVEGTLSVFAFRDNGQDPTTTVPEKKYVFLPEQLEKHYSESELGHSYSIWLPWDEAGGTRHDLSLVVRFDPKLGAAVISKPSLQRLPGAEPTTTQNGDAQASHTPAGIQRVSHEEPVEPGKKLRVVTTDTIDLPPCFLQNRQGLASDVFSIPTPPDSGCSDAVPNVAAPQTIDYQPSQSPAPAAAQAQPFPDRVTMPPFQLKRRYRPEPLPPLVQPSADSATPVNADAGPFALPAVVAD